jgi:hypothetical protein
MFLKAEKTNPIRMDRDSVELFDISIINYDNALLRFEQDIDYRKTFRLPIINAGITFHNDKYYFFDHNIVETPKSFSKVDVHAYNIYQISPKLVFKILKNFTHEPFMDIGRVYKYNSWELIFDNWINYGINYTHIKKDNYIDIKCYTTKIVDNYLISCYGRCPADYLRSLEKENISIEYFLESCKSNSEFILNKNLYRETILKSLINEE